MNAKIFEPLEVSMNPSLFRDSDLELTGLTLKIYTYKYMNRHDGYKLTGV